MLQYDVAIVGGGLVGTALAHALAHTKLRVALFDQYPAEKLYTPELDNRGLALSYISAQLLANINIWPKLVANAYAIQTVHVSRQGKFGFTKLIASKLGIPALGYVVSASTLGGALLQGIPSNIDIFRPCNIKTFCYDTQAKLWHLATDSQRFTAKLLVGADGTHSTVRSRAGIQTIVKDTEQAAVVTNVEVATSTSTAYERFTSSGVLALLPFGERRMKSVFTAEKSIIDAVLQQDARYYKAYINNLFGMRVGKFIDISKPMRFPIQEIRASNISTSGVVLLGNAANTLHPVAAQGFNLGLRDAMVLADILMNIDVVDAPLEYAKRRGQDQHATREFTQYLLQMPAMLQSMSILAAQFIPSLNSACARRGLGTWI